MRRLNLDELPQLLNIFKGEMSFVGPRPCLPSQLKLIKVRKKNNSSFVVPGLTGLAQVNSYYGMNYLQKADSEHQQLQLCYERNKHQSNLSGLIFFCI